MAHDGRGCSAGSVTVPDTWSSSEEISAAADLVARDSLRGAVALALGAAGLARVAMRNLLDTSLRPVERAALVPDERRSALPEPGEDLWQFARATVGLGLEAQRRCLGAAATVGGPVATVASAVLQTVAACGPVAAVGRGLGRWSDRGLAEQRHNQQVALTSGRAAVRAVVAAVLAEVDLDAVVARVDLDRIIGRLDLDLIVRRIDLDAVAAGLDLDALAGRLDVNAVVDRVDLAGVTARVLECVDVDAVAARLDLDAVAARLDISAVVERVDLARITEQVLDEVDVGQLVRESSGAMAAETVDAVRMQSMRVDGFLSRVVDRMLARSGDRDTGPSPAPAVPGIDRT